MPCLPVLIGTFERQGPFKAMLEMAAARNAKLAPWTIGNLQTDQNKHRCHNYEAIWKLRPGLYHSKYQIIDNNGCYLNDYIWKLFFMTCAQNLAIPDIVPA